MNAPERMSLYCVIAAYRSVNPVTAYQWTRDMAHMASRHNVIMGIWGNDALISRARSVVLSRFLESQADVLLWVDADITWNGPRPPSKDGTVPGYDGVAELWFDSLEQARAARGPAAREAGRTLLEDERQFIDLARSPIFFAEEHPIHPAP